MSYCNLKIFYSKNKSYGSSLDKVLYKVKNIVKGSSNKGSQQDLVTQCIIYFRNRYTETQFIQFHGTKSLGKRALKDSKVKFSKGQTCSSCASRTKKINNEIMIEKSVVVLVHSMKVQQKCSSEYRLKQTTVMSSVLVLTF